MNDIEVAEEQFQVLDHVPVGVFVLREDFVVVFWNSCLEDWTGIPRDQILGTYIDTHFPLLKNPIYSSRLLSIFKGGPPTIFSSQLHKYIIPSPLPGGQMRTQHTTVTSVRTSNGEDCFALFAIQDVTDLNRLVQDSRQIRDQALEEVKERTKVEEKLKHYQNQLEELVQERTQELSEAVEDLKNEITERKKVQEEKEQVQAQLLQAQKMEAVGTLAGGVAHDFNNLLTAIQGYTDLAMLSVDEADPIFHDLKQIHMAAVRAANLTRQLLLFSRKQPMELTTLPINKIIEDLLKMLNRLIGEDVTIKTSLESNRFMIQADVGNIEQLIMNLAVNARDVMPDGGEITFKTEDKYIDEEYCKKNSFARPGEFVVFSVTDTGVGMDHETIQHIFEPFYSTKGPGKGTGLGLSVVYGIVNSHGGWIQVESVPGEGSTFQVYFPACVEKIKGGEEEKEVISLQEFQGNGERILLVEDEEDVRSFTRAALQRNNYTVYETESAEKALELFESESGSFDLVFSDVVLSDQSGVQLVEQLLILNPDLNVLLCSGYTGEKSQWSAICEKGLPFLQKPYALTDLLRAIKENISQCA